MREKDDVLRFVRTRTEALELANQTNLSLQTIQRIESGETAPRGDTLKRLSNVFDLTPNDLIEWIETEDSTLLVCLNLSALSLIAFPLLGPIIPLAIWVLKRNQVINVEETGKKIINFQITWCLMLGLWYIFMFVAIAFSIFEKLPVSRLNYLYGGMGIIELCLVGITFLFYVYNIFFIVMNSLKSYQGKKNYYQPAIPFLK